MDVAYLCDGEACKRCNKRVSHCTHTTDIKHAINFDELSDDRFMEVPEPTPMDFAMSPEEFKKRMNSIRKNHKLITGAELEDVHILMDTLMCEVLRELGYSEGVDIFMNTDKWYA